MTVVTTAPTYLFWRCAPPELRDPARVPDALDGRGGRTVAVGPHGSATPETTLAKLGVDVVVRGECEEVVPRSPTAAISPTSPRSRSATRWRSASPAGRRRTPLHRPAGAALAATNGSRGITIIIIASTARRTAPAPRSRPRAAVPIPAASAPRSIFATNTAGAISRRLLEEIDGLIAQGATYLYFIDEIFLPQRPLLEALVERPVEFGVQTRIDLWKPDMLDLLGAAGCVSIEAGVESLTVEGRARSTRTAGMSTDELAERLIYARSRVPFVQANLIKTADDDPR